MSDEPKLYYLGMETTVEGPVEGRPGWLWCVDQVPVGKPKKRKFEQRRVQHWHEQVTPTPYREYT